jgi:prepilin-type N-terminal cleavage/methylation domain-containing protein
MRQFSVNDMIKASSTSGVRAGFSLAEVLAALTISAMVLAAVVAIYSRAQHSAAAIVRKLDSTRLSAEVLQAITEDLDTITVSGPDTRITIENKFDKDIPTARMTIRKIVYDSRNREQTFEQIIWQTSYDYDSDANGLVLYRSRTGMALEDKLLDEQRDGSETAYSFIPICAGITYFKIQVPRGENFQDRWTSPSLPPGITVTMSFAEPFRTVRGTLDVPEEEKITRTIAIDRTRKMKFALATKEEREDQEGMKRAPLSEGETSRLGGTQVTKRVK